MHQSFPAPFSPYPSVSEKIADLEPHGRASTGQPERIMGADVHLGPRRDRDKVVGRRGDFSAIVDRDVKFDAAEFRRAPVRIDAEIVIRKSDRLRPDHATTESSFTTWGRRTTPPATRSRRGSSEPETENSMPRLRVVPTIVKTLPASYPK